MVGRYVKLTAKPGHVDVLAQSMLEGRPERIDLEPIGGVGFPDR